MSRRRVVVTGLGATTPLGGDVPTTWANLLAGKSGVRKLEDEWAQEASVTFAARVAVEPSEVMERVEMRRLDRSEQFALIAAREAWKDAGAPDVNKERLGVVIASGIGGVITLLDQYDILKTKGARMVSPHTVPMLMPNGPSANVGLELQAKAGVHTPVAACASGAEAAGYALEMIRNSRDDDPTKASRPYDKDRDGFVLGEGGGVLVFEELEHAKARGAKIYAEVMGQGLTSDGYHIAAPDPDGAGVTRAVKFALEDAGIPLSEIVHLNAHATSTPAGDVAEANALTNALGADISHVAVSATKSMTGHLLGGAGAIESIFCVLAMYHHKAPPTINIENLDDAVKVDIVRDVPRDLPSGSIACLNDSFGFGGHNVVLVLRRLISTNIEFPHFIGSESFDFRNETILRG